MNINSDEGFLLGNLDTKYTGLRAVVWLRNCEEGTPLIIYLSKNLRINSIGYKLDVDRQAIVEKDVDADFMIEDDFDELWVWTKLNLATIGQYSRGEIDLVEVSERLQPLVRTVK